jgi:hypothetical protein
VKRSLAFGLLSLGCTVQHLEKNAPGSIAVMEKPENMKLREVEQQTDPGERMLQLRYGAMAAGGFFIPEEQGKSQGSYGIGPEVTVLYGTRKYSHDDDAFWLMPDEAFGGGIGWMALLEPGESVGPVYGELEYASGAAWLTGGWAYEIDDELHGPHVSVGFGPLFVRYTHLLDAGGLLHFGMAFKGQASFVWNASARGSARD